MQILRYWHGFENLYTSPSWTEICLDIACVKILCACILYMFMYMCIYLCTYINNSDLWLMFLTCTLSDFIWLLDLSHCLIPSSSLHSYRLRMCSILLFCTLSEMTKNKDHQSVIFAIFRRIYETDNISSFQHVQHFQHIEKRICYTYNICFGHGELKAIDW